MPSRDAFNDRLSRIQTSWSLVRQAHDASNPTASEARRELFERYCGAARRYLRAIARDEDMAEELLQEFAVGFLGGALHRADQALGTFRGYVKTVLINLARRRGRSGRMIEAQLSYEPAAESSQDDAIFDSGWRAELLSLAWRELEEFEQSSQRPYYTLLRFKVEHPDATSADLAGLLGKLLGRPEYSEAAARKTLQRARDLFARLLVRAVRDTLADPQRDELVAELQTLGLMPYCESTL